MRIDRAIFSSTEARRSRGYHLIAASDGLTPREARELTRWGPSHDSLLCPSGSTNFHSLLSGRLCVSRTTATDAEPSCRGGLRVVTQFLVLNESQFRQFGSNPFAVFAAVEDCGGFLDEVPNDNQLDELTINAPNAVNLDRDAVESVLTELGGHKLANLLHLTIESPQLGIVGSQSPEHLIRSLISLIPPASRIGFSFSTGLRFSNSRPFRIIPVEDDLYQRKMVLRTGRTTIVDLNQDFPCELASNHGWASVIEDALRRSAIEELAAFYEVLSQGPVDPQGIDDLAERWYESIADSKPAEECRTQECRTQAIAVVASPAEDAVSTQSTVPISVPCAERPAAKLDLTRGDLVDELGQLDDAVLDALNGDTRALSSLQDLWPKLVRILPQGLIEESRAQYLQFALQAWEAKQREGRRDAGKAIALLEMLSFLFAGEK